MDALRRGWATWVALWDHHEHPRSLAMVRIALAACLLWDFGWMAALDLVVPLWGPEAAGGWARVLDRGDVPWLWEVLPAEPWAAWLVWGVLVTCALAVLTGIGMPQACLLYVLVSAQTAHTLDAADRGIDTMIRNVMLILAFSGADRTWSIRAWWRSGRFTGPRDDIPAWPRHLLILQLVIMYTGAGVAKLGSTWTPMGEFAALYEILHDPAVARFDFKPIAAFIYPFTQFGTATTIVWEYASPLVLLVYWYRHTWDRPGRLRAFSNRWHLHWWWLSVGVAFHVLIAITLNLGIFPFAMLAFYPAFVHPDEWWWVRGASRGAARATPVPDPA